MKKFILPLLSTLLCACSNIQPETTVIVDKDILFGRWHCVLTAPQLTLNKTTTYLSNGILNTTATYNLKVADVDGDFSYQFKITGRWKLKDNTIDEYIDSITVKSLNKFSQPFEKLYKKSFQKKAEKKISSTVLTMNESKLNLINTADEVSSCEKIIN